MKRQSKIIRKKQQFEQQSIKFKIKENNIEIFLRNKIRCRMQKNDK